MKKHDYSNILALTSLPEHILDPLLAYCDENGLHCEYYLKQLAALASSDPAIITETLALQGRTPGDFPLFGLTRKKISTLGLPVRTVNALKGLCIETIGDLLPKREQDLLLINGLGLYSLARIKAALQSLD